MNSTADYQVVAWSGKGVVRNFGDPNTTSSCPENCPMPAFFNRTLAWDSKLIYDFSLFVPSAIVTNLGTNDFSTTPNPSNAEFVSGYLQLIDQYRAAYGDKVPIFLMCGPLIGNPCCEYVQQVVKLATNTFYIPVPPLEPIDIACGHPSKRGHEVMFSDAYSVIASVMNW